MRSTRASKLPYDAHKDFAPVGPVARSFNIVVVNPASPIKSIAAAKAELEKLSYGQSGHYHKMRSGLLPLPATARP